MKKLPVACALAAMTLQLTTACGPQSSGPEEGSSPGVGASEPLTPPGAATPAPGGSKTGPGVTSPGTPTDPGSSATAPTSPAQSDVLPTPKRVRVANSLAELRTLLASALPGDRIELADGTYSNTQALTVSVKGTAEEPIVVTAQTVGGAVITGTAGFKVSGSEHLVLRGFKLTHTVPEGGVAFSLAASRHVRITRNEFALNDTTSSSTWMRVEGAGSGFNRIDHNFFHDKPSNNVFLAVYGDAPDGGLGVSQKDSIDHNHFLSQTFPSEGGECIRIGDSKRGVLSSGTLLEANLFERCDGDPEVISNKTGEVTIRGNTLRNNKGSLVLRHGNRSVVEGNFLLDNVGGMRVYGHDHLIRNNYFENNSGTGAQATLILSSGCTEADTGSGGDCSVATRVTVANNTLVGNLKTHLVVGASPSTRPIAPRDCRVENNLVQGEQATLVQFVAPPSGFTWAGNVLWGAAATGSIPATGYVRQDPLLQRGSDGLLHPTADIAAGRVPSAAGTPGSRPLTPADVGPHAP